MENESDQQKLPPIEIGSCAAFDYGRLFIGENTFANSTKSRASFLFYRHTNPWDHVPGLFLHREAGGYSADWSGQPYNVDPLPYEQRYGGNFMNSDGSIKPSDEIAKDPKALAAYNAWLQDPAISAQQGPLFATQSGGALMSMYDHLLGGGGG